MQQTFLHTFKNLMAVISVSFLQNLNNAELKLVVWVDDLLKMGLGFSKAKYLQCYLSHRQKHLKFCDLFSTLRNKVKNLSQF